MRPSRSWLPLVAALIACGCALTAKRPPTPAADLTTADVAALPKPPGERFFLVLYGCHDIFHRPSRSHTWGTLVRVPCSEVGKCGPATPGCVDPALTEYTISWLPVTGKIEVSSRNVEPGRNYGLHETMQFAADADASVAIWGPYEVWHGTAHRFVIQKQFLDSGVVGYQANDNRGEAARLGNGCDCIHAITDMDPEYPRWRYPLAFWGKPATANLVRRIMRSPAIIDPPTTHDWLLPRLGLTPDQYTQREYVGRVQGYPGGPGVPSFASPLPAIPCPPPAVPAAPANP